MPVLKQILLDENFKFLRVYTMTTTYIHTNTSTLLIKGTENVEKKST